MRWLIVSRLWDEGAIALLWLLSLYLRKRLEQAEGERREKLQDISDLVGEAIERLRAVRN